MPTTMYDSVTAGDIPASAGMVAGYVTGRYAWTEADWARFPTARRVEIATSAAFNTGDVLDVEVGDATPAQAPGWIDRRRATGMHRPTIYCPKASMNAVLLFCSEAGLAVTHHYDLWIAEWTGHPHPVGVAAATQYANPNTSGGHYDLSAVYDDAWPHRTAPAPPPPAPIPTPIEELLETMDFYILNDNNDATADQWYWWPELGGGEGRRAIVPSPTAVTLARTSRRFCGDLIFDRPDLDAIATLR